MISALLSRDCDMDQHRFTTNYLLKLDDTITVTRFIPALYVALHPSMIHSPHYCTMSQEDFLQA